MTLYLEYVIIDNLIINFLIIFVTSRILKIKTTNFLICVSSVFGTALAVIFPLLQLNGFYSFLYKLLCGIGMCLIFLKEKNKKKLLPTFLMFIVITFCMGGLSYGLVIMLGGAMLDLSTYKLSFPVGIFILPCFILANYLINLSKMLYKKSQTEKHVYQLKIELNGKQIVIDAFYDSGNNFTDAITAKPVIILSYEVMQALEKRFTLLDLIIKKQFNLNDCHYAKFGTLSGSSDIMIFKADALNLLLDNKTILLNDFMCGVIAKPIGKNSNIQGLLHSQCL